MACPCSAELTFLLKDWSLRRLELSRASPGPTTPSETLIACSSCCRFSNRGFNARRAAWGPNDLGGGGDGAGDGERDKEGERAGGDGEGEGERD